MLVKQKSLSHFCEKGFCIYFNSVRYMRQASSHRQSGMIMEIIMKPCSRINLCFFLRFVLAKLYTLCKLTKQNPVFLYLCHK